MKIPLLDLKRQIAAVGTPLDAAMQGVLQETAFVGGRHVAEFEVAFAAFCEVPHVVACANGTDALEMALGALGIGAGDRVVTTSHTFIATVEAIVNVGAEPILIDVDPATLLMDLVALERTLNATGRVRAIVPVHLYGNMVPMDRVLALGKEHDAAVIEDTAQAHGARFSGKRAGSFGHLGTFSFFPGKNLGAFGDGGAVSTSDDTLKRYLETRRNHGRSDKYLHHWFGRNSRLDALQATVLSAKLPHLEAWNAARRAVAAHYDAVLPKQLARVAITAGCEPVYHQYVIRHARRDRLRLCLEEAGVETGLHYPIPVHEQPAWLAQGLPKLSLPVTEQAAREVLSLPMFPELTHQQVQYVSSALENAL